MTDIASPKYKRVLLKLSGESFARPGESGICLSEVRVICEQIKRVVESGVQLAIVCGGGNILRGREFSSSNSIVVPATAHYMGMLATAMNALALQDSLEHFGVATRIQSAITIPPVSGTFSLPWISKRAISLSRIRIRKRRMRSILILSKQFF